MTTQPPIYTLHNALLSPIILTGPHNGWYVPSQLIHGGKPLGLDTHWFDPADPLRRHEACDWGIYDLFNSIGQKNSNIALLGATHSRLVVDLNRNPNTMIYDRSSELDTVIPGNTALDEGEHKSRLENYYMPYHDVLDALLQDTKAKFGHVLWLDMHSFTPIWQGQPRTVGVGTLKTAQTAFTNKAEEWLAQTFGGQFKADEPYSMRKPEFRNISGGYSASIRNNVPYFGLEIRNDLLQTSEQIEDMALKILGLIEAL